MHSPRYALVGGPSHKESAPSFCCNRRHVYCANQVPSFWRCLIQYAAWRALCSNGHIKVAVPHCRFLYRRRIKRRGHVASLPPSIPPTFLLRQHQAFIETYDRRRNVVSPSPPINASPPHADGGSGATLRLPLAKMSKLLPVNRRSDTVKLAGAASLAIVLPE